MTKSTKVRVLDECSDIERPGRRTFLHQLTAQGASIPAAYFLLGGGIADAHAAPTATLKSTAVRGPTATDMGRIIRDFSDPYLELMRLLHEASEIEHALMVQYLYAAFSIKPAYAAVAGFGIPNSTDLLGVAVQEMQHLSQVNELLVALGACPSLVRENFPYEPDIYPFKFQLEPLSQKSLAKYLYAESPPVALDRRKATNAKDRAMLDSLDRTLGKNVKVNHVGSLYDNIGSRLKEYIASSKDEAEQLSPWIAKLEEIKRQGEDDHFDFFKQLFTGTHAGFRGKSAIWSLPPSDPAYPARPLPVNPSAYVGHKNQIEDPLALSLAWLGNLHYWIILLFVDLGYRTKDSELGILAKQQMLGPFWSIARQLSIMGAGMPFDPLAMGYSTAKTEQHQLKFISCMVNEADRVARRLGSRLPTDYPVSIGSETLSELAPVKARYVARAYQEHRASY